MNKISKPAPTNSYYLWEISLRVFHWLLVAVIVGLVISAEVGGDWMDYHNNLGITALALIIFRVVLGIFGGELIQFHRAIAPPSAVISYIKGSWRGFGHNPVAAGGMVSILIIILFMAVSGMFANVDNLFTGVLYKYISSDLSDEITRLHKMAKPALIIVIALHIGAILYYLIFKKNNLIKPMIWGNKEVGTAAELPQKPFCTSHPVVISFGLIIAISTGIFLKYFV